MDVSDVPTNWISHIVMHIKSTINLTESTNVSGEYTIKNKLDHLSQTKYTHPKNTATQIVSICRQTARK